MLFLAGIVVAWTALEILVACFSAIAYFLFGRNRLYLIYAAFSFCLSLFYLGKSVQYLAVNYPQASLAVRLTYASLPPAAVALLYLAIYSFGLGIKLTRQVISLVGLLALGFSGICLYGLCLDESRPLYRIVHLFGQDAAIRRFPITGWGYAATIYSIGVSVVAGILLAQRNRRDRMARYAFILGIVILLALGINDVLLVADVVKSVFLVEYGLFLMNLCVLIGLFRVYELSRRELQDRTSALERATQRLDRVTDETRRLRPMADLGRLSASLAHEIRNPLAVLNNVASTLQRQGVAQADSERYHALIRILQEETDRLARLVDDLLAFSHAGRTSRDPVEADWLIRQATADAMHQIPADAGVELILEVEQALPTLPGNADNLRRALVNLIVNAVQSSRRGGKVTVVARFNPDAPERLVIGITDEAGGISEQELSEIFEPFYSTRPTGTGLGLPIAKSIVEAHNGNLVLENRPGVGASFWMYLPVRPVTGK